ncbi:lysM and putative peptidoglycan-binding domain-containing protein 1-like [Rhinatrema bivittatum]|uniref:lysM and putative peptidoglycan-binding domain-containing protein 1-like n=1 Tax=Rhinatrema bivittatum TaxID=194408 RepID=UPI001127EBA6|nr:lysM and putative peptidoglycan-binding domain-containing protein 1-like [Rhinatrema bivittatum]XP_029436438.1 lysM and putative peptidoglycan-binding domain-containing protein 1-like [Rhinatrema bivittatum]XP_029437416.1 lysM and putative peptidoglycan-binding domain-containing protein 1-like [Rhinatrema bivittatum]XP_029437417.1 lysM and putative peptidoglycan-binding domain-containing protein 1-like [Rhinatrema bivittatum]
MASSPGQGSSGGSALLRGARTRSYGSLVQSAYSPVRQRRIEHQLDPGDTLQGLALKYGVTMEQIKRANRLYTGDSIFLKKTLYIPILMEQKGLSPEEEGRGERDVSTNQPEEGEEETVAQGAAQPEDLSAKDFLKKLDSKITVSKRAVVKTLHNSEILIPQGEASSCSGTSSCRGATRDQDGTRSPRTHQRSLLGPVPLTRTTRAATLKDHEDELFKL